MRPFAIIVSTDDQYVYGAYETSTGKCDVCFAPAAYETRTLRGEDAVGTFGYCAACWEASKRAAGQSAPETFYYPR